MSVEENKALVRREQGELWMYQILATEVALGVCLNVKT